MDQQRRRARRDPELGFGQHRDHGSLHADGQSDEKDLQQLLAELAEVVPDAWLVISHAYA